MTHGEGWQFIQAGRFLERAIAVSTLVSVHFREFYDEAAAEVEPLEWIGLLQSCTAFEAYCKAYTADLRADRIAEFLVLNAVFPHSIRFSADALAASLKQIAWEAAGASAGSAGGTDRGSDAGYAGVRADGRDHERRVAGVSGYGPSAVSRPEVMGLCIRRM